MENPKFSVIVPAHNEEDVISRCIQSIQKQTFKNFELIISNDGSTDNTKKIVENYIKIDDRIRIVNSDEGHSAAYARNKGARSAKGEIFVFIDADTFINEVFLFEIDKLKECGDAFITLNYPFKKHFVSKILSSFLGPNQKEKLEDATIYDLKNKDIAGAMFFCISREYYNKVGGYSEKIFYYEDHDFVEKFYKIGGKSVFVKNAMQFYELPSTISEFFRQCKWLGKGTNLIPDPKVRNRRRIYWFAKASFSLLPLFFLSSVKMFLLVLSFTFLIMYFLLVLRNHKPVISILAMPFLYAKNILVSLNIVRFFNKKI